MFNVMFEGAVGEAVASGILTEQQALEYNTLADRVFADLKTIVDFTLQNSTYKLEGK